jgi:hypothetical protein
VETAPVAAKAAQGMVAAVETEEEGEINRGRKP